MGDAYKVYGRPRQVPLFFASGLLTSLLPGVLLGQVVPGVRWHFLTFVKYLYGGEHWHCFHPKQRSGHSWSMCGWCGHLIDRYFEWLRFRSTPLRLFYSNNQRSTDAFSANQTSMRAGRSGLGSLEYVYSACVMRFTFPPSRFSCDQQTIPILLTIAALALISKSWECKRFITFAFQRPPALIFVQVSWQLGYGVGTQISGFGSSFLSPASKQFGALKTQNHCNICTARLPHKLCLWNWNPNSELRLTGSSIYSKSFCSGFNHPNCSGSTALVDSQSSHGNSLFDPRDARLAQEKPATPFVRIVSQISCK